MKKQKPIKIILFKITTIIISFLFCIFLIEFLLGFIKIKKLDYNDVYGTLEEGGCLKKNFKGYVVGASGNFVYWQTNSKGFRNTKEFDYIPASNVLRILSIGDSFTAGYRIGQNETFSFLLEKWINKTYKKSEVLISCIEEPTTGLYYLSKFGQKYNPDIILLGITIGNDIAQTFPHLMHNPGYLSFHFLQATFHFEGKSIMPAPRTPLIPIFSSFLPAVF